MPAAKPRSGTGDWLRAIGLAIGFLAALAVSHVKICERLAVLETNQRILMDIAYGKMKANAHPIGNDRADATPISRR